MLSLIFFKSLKRIFILKLLYKKLYNYRDNKIKYILLNLNYDRIIIINNSSQNWFFYIFSHRHVNTQYGYGSSSMLKIIFKKLIKFYQKLNNKYLII